MNANETPSPIPPPPSVPVTNGRKNARFTSDQTLQVNSRTGGPSHVKPDRRKDIKLTNCQEKDGIWTATAQFGRESRHSKRAEITYDKKKFRFTQKDDQGNKHVFEIPAADIEGKDRLQEKQFYLIHDYIYHLILKTTTTASELIFIFFSEIYASTSRLKNKNLILNTCTNVSPILFPYSLLFCSRTIIVEKMPVESLLFFYLFSQSISIIAEHGR